MKAIPILSPMLPADARHGGIRTDLERSGRSIGSDELRNAAQCLATDIRPVIAKLEAFRRVPGLIDEN